MPELVETAPMRDQNRYFISVWPVDCHLPDHNGQRHRIGNGEVVKGAYFEHYILQPGVRNKIIGQLKELTPEELEDLKSEGKYVLAADVDDTEAFIRGQTLRGINLAHQFPREYTAPDGPPLYTQAQAQAMIEEQLGKLLPAAVSLAISQQGEAFANANAKDDTVEDEGSKKTTTRVKKTTTRVKKSRKKSADDVLEDFKSGS